MSEHMNFSSFPAEQEMQFVVFETRMEEAQKKGWTFALVAAIAVFVIAFGVYLGVTPDETDISKDMNMSNLTHTNEPGSGSAAAPAAAPAGSAAAPAPAEAPAGSAAPAAN